MASREIRQWLSRELPKWKASGWVTEAGEQGLKEMYGPLPERVDPGNRLIVILASLGAALIGGGIILLFAYNWTHFGRPLRAALSFTPLLLAQALTLFTVLRKPDSRAWREGSAVALTASVAACIALIGQTYNIQGDLGGFLLTWMILTFPLVFILRSPITCFALLAQHAWWTGYARFQNDHLPMAWVIFILILVAIIWLQKSEKKERIGLNLTTAFAATYLLLVATDTSAWNGWLLLLVPWLVLFVLAPVAFPKTQSFTVISVLAKVFLLILVYCATYSDFWNTRTIGPDAWSFRWEWMLSSMLFLACSILLVRHWAQVNARERLWMMLPYLTFACWLGGLYELALPVAVGVNLALAAYALAVLLPAWRQRDDQGIRLGATLLTLLLLLRFFDLDFSLLTRGIAFILIGTAFLVIIYRIHLSRKKEATR
jgi:uncharacterized membrane protein